MRVGPSRTHILRCCRSGLAAESTGTVEPFPEHTPTMLRHLVLLRFKPAASPAEIAALEQAFCALKASIGGISELESGTDVSPEGLAKGFTHAFMLSFDGPAQRDAYLPHPAHQAFVQRLRPALDDVLVLDYEARSAG
jgi:Stress responsive A/B Barrel Domain